MVIRGWISKRHKLSWSRLAPYAFLYILLPIILFSLLWLRPVIGIPIALLVVLVGFLAAVPQLCSRWRWIRCFAQDDKILDNPLTYLVGNAKKADLSIANGVLVLLFLLALMWCFLGGHGGAWAQSPDWIMRNAVFSDLITHSWPVYYDEGSSALVYYLNHWLPPAAPAQIFYMLTNNYELCWAFGNGLLLIWTALGVFLVELLIIVILHITTPRKIVFAMMIFVFFSGMDVVGIIAKALYGRADLATAAINAMHLEWWTGPGTYQFSSNTTLLYWVFNQTIIPWVCTGIFLLSQSTRSYFLVFVACFAAGPYAAVGLAIMMLFMVFHLLAGMGKAGEIKKWFTMVFSPINIIALFPFVIYVFYFLCNQSFANSGERFGLFGLVPGTTFWTVLLFIILEVGILLIILAKEYSKTPLFLAVCVTFFLVPFIHVGSRYEFCCRASIPALFVVMLMCICFLFKKSTEMKSKPINRSLSAWLLVLCLFFGSVTPLFEISRGFVRVRNEGIENVIQSAGDIEKSRVELGQANNFKASIMENNVFYLSLAREDA